MRPIVLQLATAAFAAAALAPAFAGHIDPDDRREIAAARQATVIPTQAVRAAEATGGMAYGFGMEVEGTRHWYKVNLLRGADKVQVRIDATTGKVLGSAPARGEDAQGAHALAGSGLSLAAAVAHAEREGNGPALEADVGKAGDHVYVDVDVIQAQGRRVAHYRVTTQGKALIVTLTGSDT